MTRPTLLAVITVAALIALPGPAPAESEAREAGTPASLLALEARRLSGGTESLDRYRGQVLLVVNTASRCGYTPQYEGLQALYDRYRAQGFSVLGFPANDFGRQEPGSDSQIRAFCRSNYGVEFPMFSKVRVNGANAHPVYVYLTSLPEPIGGPVQWNFQKYLVDRRGEVVARYAPGVSPRDPGLVDAIERLLAEPRPGEPEAGPRR
jgi:glutathione peroxidase